MGKNKGFRGFAGGKFDPKLKQKIKQKNHQQEQEHILKDDRFAKIATDPRFRGIPNQEKKVKVDPRFKSMFTDKRFNQKHTVDKRGRPVNFSTTDDIAKFYEVEKDDEKKKKKKDDESSSSDSDDVEEDRDIARGEGLSESSSDSDDSDEEEQEDTVTIEHPWSELAADAPRTEETSNRLALVNIDWDNIKAEDIFALLDSFKPSGGLLKSVSIYLSDFGAERMEKEKLHGPLELKKDEDEDESDGGDQEENEQEANERLRQYQLNRLKYYYAVIVCDTKKTAEAIYDAVDGMEYGNSSAPIDLRFIPDEETFDKEPTQSCSSLPVNFKPNEFVVTALQQSKVDCNWDLTPRDKLKTDKINWEKEDAYKDLIASASSEDEEDQPEEVNGEDFDKRSMKSMREADMIEKYRALIAEIDQKSSKEKKGKNLDGNESDSDGDYDMEIKWDPAAEEKAVDMVKKKKEDAEKEKMTPFEKMMQKQKEKRKERKQAKKGGKKVKEDSENDSDGSEEDESEVDDGNDDSEDNGEDGQEADEKFASAADLQLLLGNKEKDGKKHYNLKKLVKEAANSKTQRKKKRKLGEVENPTSEDGFQIDVKDPRFEALFTSSHYNLDQSDPAFKRTKVTEEIVKEKMKRKAKREEPEGSNTKSSGSIASTSASSSKLRPELNILTKSIKSKLKSAGKK